MLIAIPVEDDGAHEEEGAGQDVEDDRHAIGEEKVLIVKKCILSSCHVHLAEDGHGGEQDQVLHHLHAKHKGEYQGEGLACAPEY